MNAPSIDWKKTLQTLADGHKDKDTGIQMRAQAAIICAYIQELEKIIDEADVKQQDEQSIDKSEIVSKLYTIRNIANLAFQCPDSCIEVYILQDIVKHISEMSQSLIEEINI